MFASESENKCGDCRWMEKDQTQGPIDDGNDITGHCRLFKIPTSEGTTPQQRAQEISPASILAPNLALMRRGLCFEEQLPEPQEKTILPKTSTYF